MKRVLLCLAFVSMYSCRAPEITVIRPTLMFTISTETGLKAPRDLTVDDAGNIMVFDYGNYMIRKFAPSGEILATLGGPEGVAGGFRPAPNGNTRPGRQRAGPGCRCSLDFRFVGPTTDNPRLLRHHYLRPPSPSFKWRVDRRVDRRRNC